MTSSKNTDHFAPPRASEEILVAIVLPVYNVSLYLRECLDSIQAQTYTNFVVFAIDDGSTDESGAILDEYARNDSRFCVIHKENQGVAAARNVALEALERDSRFDGVCFIDSDDYVLPNFIHTYVNLSKKYKADYVVCAWTTFDALGVNHIPRNHILDHPLRVLDKDGVYKHYFNTNEWKNKSKTISLFCSNVYFSARSIVGLRFDERLVNAEDQDFRIRALARINRGVITSSSTYMYRLRKSSISHSMSDHLYDMIVNVRLLSATDGLPDSCIQEIENHACSLWWLCVYSSVIDGTFETKREAIVAAFNAIRSHRFSNVKIRRRYWKKFFLFSLGKFCLKSYFLIRKKPKTEILLHAFP